MAAGNQGTRKLLGRSTGKSNVRRPQVWTLDLGNARIHLSRTTPFALWLSRGENVRPVLIVCPDNAMSGHVPHLLTEVHADGVDDYELLRADADTFADVLGMLLGALSGRVTPDLADELRAVVRGKE